MLEWGEWIAWHVIGGYVLLLLTAGSITGLIACAAWQMTVWLIRNYVKDDDEPRLPPKSPNHPSVQQ